MTGAVMARGVELTLPVSFLIVRCNLVNSLQLPKDDIQALPVKPIVTSSLVVVTDEKLKKTDRSPKDQFSCMLKSVQM